MASVTYGKRNTASVIMANVFMTKVLLQITDPNQRFTGYHCKLDIAFFAWRVTWNNFYSLFKVNLDTSADKSVCLLLLLQNLNTTKNEISMGQEHFLILAFWGSNFIFVFYLFNN